MRKKHWITLFSIMLVAALSIGMTLAYFTDSESAKNTFTVGKVNITLDETDVDDSSETDRDKANTYHLLPGHSYVKDPQVTVLVDSEDSYIRMIVNVKNMDQLKAAFPDEGETSKYYADENGERVFLLQMLVSGWDSRTWVYEEGYEESTTNNITTGTYEFRYNDIVKKNAEDTPLEELFKEIVVPGEIDNAHIAYLENVEINVEAHAIQAAGFDDADAAWSAFSK